MMFFRWHAPKDIHHLHKMGVNVGSSHSEVFQTFSRRTKTINAVLFFGCHTMAYEDVIESSKNIPKVYKIVKTSATKQRKNVK